MFKDLFTFVTIIVVVLLAAFVLYVKNPKKWWKEQDGKGAAASALLGIAVILVVGTVLGLLLYPLSGKAEEIQQAEAYSVEDARAYDYTKLVNSSSSFIASGKFFNYAYVYAGIDRTFKVSPQCVPKGNFADDRLTSNMGFGINLWKSESSRVLVDGIYHHQSCVFGSDRNSYDGLGIQARWIFWER